MPAAVVAIATVIASVAGTVAAVVAPIASALAAALAPAISAIGSVIGAIVKGLGAALAPITTAVGGVANWVVTSIGQTVAGLYETVASTVKPFLTKLGEAIGKITEGITAATKPILEPIKAGLEAVKGALDKVQQWVTTAFHPSARMGELQAAHPELWEAAEHVPSTFTMMLETEGVITATEASLLALPDVLQTINQVATLKVLADLVKGQASVSDLLGKISEGKAFETAQAIAELSKGIVTSTVGIMDRVDTEVGILRATIDTFDERLETSVREYIQVTKAEILSIMTPKMAVLGEQQAGLNRSIARLWRHIEDESWFGYMLIQALTTRW